MSEKHKSKYKKPENKKATHRKDMKDYTMDDKTGSLNPKSTGDKQLNVLRKTDKPIQDDGKLYPKYNADDRLYKDIEDGDYDPKLAAKRLKKRQDADEKLSKDQLKDKIENLTREQKERLVREYIRRKLVPILLEQPDKDKETDTADAEAEEPATDTATADTGADAATTDTAGATDTGAATTDTAGTTAPGAATTDTTATADTGAATTDTAGAEDDTAGAEDTSTDATTKDEPAGDDAETKDSEEKVSPETKETIDLDRFIKYLEKQDGMIAKIKVLIKVMNIALNDTDPADKINFFKMLRSTAIKKLGSLDAEKNSNK